LLVAGSGGVPWALYGRERGSDGDSGDEQQHAADGSGPVHCRLHRLRV